jgi:hypothetical protein
MAFERRRVVSTESLPDRDGDSVEHDLPEHVDAFDLVVHQRNQPETLVEELGMRPSASVAGQEKSSMVFDTAEKLGAGLLSMLECEVHVYAVLAQSRPCAGKTRPAALPPFVLRGSRVGSGPELHDAG